MRSAFRFDKLAHPFTLHHRDESVCAGIQQSSLFTRWTQLQFKLVERTSEKEKTWTETREEKIINWLIETDLYRQIAAATRRSLNTQIILLYFIYIFFLPVAAFPSPAIFITRISIEKWPNTINWHLVPLPPPPFSDRPSTNRELNRRKSVFFSRLRSKLETTDKLHKNTTTELWKKETLDWSAACMLLITTTITTRPTDYSLLVSDAIYAYTTEIWDVRSHKAAQFHSLKETEKLTLHTHAHQRECTYARIQCAKEYVVQ